MAGEAQLKKMWGKVVLGELSVWTLADCEWRAAAPLRPGGRLNTNFGIQIELSRLIPTSFQKIRV